VEKGSCTNSAQPMWGEVECDGAQCGKPMYHGSGIVIAAYAVEACQTVPESCEKGNAMGISPSLLSKLSASDSNVSPGIGLRCAASAPGGDGGWRARLAEVFHTNTRPVELPSMALPG